jgi:hypothetical protein
MNTTISALLPAILLGLGACAAEEPPATGQDQFAVVVAPTVASLAGTWVPADRQAKSVFDKLSLAKGGTYVAEHPCPSGNAPGCNNVKLEQGSFKTRVSGPQLGAPQGEAQIVFTSSGGQVNVFGIEAHQVGLTLTDGQIARRALTFNGVQTIPYGCANRPAAHPMFRERSGLDVRCVLGVNAATAQAPNVLWTIANLVDALCKQSVDIAGLTLTCSYVPAR